MPKPWEAETSGAERRVQFATFPTLAIDPGDVHCGMALFNEGKCLDAWKMKPVECERFVQSALREQEIQALVVEEFRLYPWESDAQAWSQFLTVEVIGVLRWLWLTEGTNCIWKEQGANIKKPSRGILRMRKIKSMAKAKGAGGHALDAELHGYHFLLRYSEQEREHMKQNPGDYPL